MENYFIELNSINVSDKTEKKNGLTYLSWAWAWGEVKKQFPDATYTVYENEQGWNYFTDGRTGWVKTGATVNGIEHIEYLPIMDYRNKSIPLESITSFDVNKTIQRSLTKALARHGLGLYIYAGEDLPEGEEITTKEQAENYIISFGKHSGKTLKEICDVDINYIDWLFNNEKTDQVIKQCITLITGKIETSQEEKEEILNLTVRLNELIRDKDVNYEKLLKHYNVKSNTEMTLEQLRDAVSKLESK